MKGNRAILFDLDGTLVRDFRKGDTTRGPRSRDEVEILPGTREALEALRHANYWIIVVSNQPGIARGDVDPLQHRGVRLLVQRDLPILKTYVCPHDGIWCACRKPRPGMIFSAAVEHELDLSRCWSIGDRDRDREAAIRAGIPLAQTILIPTNHGIAKSVQYILEHDHED